ncbi:MAG TPA: tRNA pseudouridine synthase A, partial [Gemmatimonadales bacterium]|nr:tRNA pseudouridine synthase A [Gemmatimonadales bacterium]
GVHALGMGVSFPAPPRWTADGLRRALNALLPRDCWVEAVHPMRDGFHARKSAVGRRYRYVIGTDAAAASPFRRPFEWALGRPLDLPALEAAARRIEGTHDFRAFAVKDGSKPHHRCTIRQAVWRVRGGDRGVVFEVAADRFLHHMVRFLVGTMVDIALGRRPSEDMTRLLASPDNQATSPPAPPHGLYFVAAEYPADCFAAPDGVAA